MADGRIEVATVADAATARACAALRHDVFLAPYGPLGLRDWPGVPDAYDTGPGFLVARQGGRVVGTALVRHAIYDPARPFWHERFGVPVPELVPAAAGKRIGEAGRLAVDKTATDRPLDIAAALADAVIGHIRRARAGPVVAAAMSAPMLGFYQEIARRHGATLRVHPRRGLAGGFEMTLMVLTLREQEVF